MLTCIVIIFIAATIVVAFRLSDLITQIIFVQKLPGPPKRDIISGNWAGAGRNPEIMFKSVQEWNQQYFPIYKLWISHLSSAQILDPEDFEIICSNVKHNKKGLVYGLLTRWLKTGLLTSNGEKWQNSRKILTPSFHFSILQNFVPIFNEATDELIEMLTSECGKPYTDVVPPISQFTLKSIAESSMGTKLDFLTQKENDYKNAINGFNKIFVDRISTPWLAVDFLYVFSSTYLEELRLVKTLQKFTKSVITQRENNFHNTSFEKLPSRKNRLAMLDLLLSAKHSDGSIDDEGIRQEVDTFMFEGHDTTSSAISFSLMLLACYPEIQNRVFEEISVILDDFKRKPTLQDLQEMRYLERCIKEVLRMYPSVFLMGRELGEDIETSSGYKLKKGTQVLLHIYGMQHNPNIYPNPEKFDPDRFLPEEIQKRHPFAYLPFSAGSRNCIGQRFAMLELKAVLCGILANFHLEPVDTPETVVLVMNIVLKAKHGVKVKLTKRI